MLCLGWSGDRTLGNSFILFADFFNDDHTMVFTLHTMS